MRHILRIALCFLSGLMFVPRIASAEDLFIASWNVENLFDLEDDPNVALDEEYTPQAPKRWTRERLDIKLNNLVKIIGKMNGGRGPDVLGLCEVENRKVVEMLVAKLAPLGRKYQIVHKDSPSDRGIDTALIYDANVFGMEDSKFHFVDAERTRDIVEAKLTRGGKGLYVFVNHWPSRGNDEWQRIMAAVAAPTQAFYSGEPGLAPAASPRTAGTEPASRTAANLNLVLVDSRRHARDFMESTDGEAIIMDIVRRRRVELGIKS